MHTVNKRLIWTGHTGLNMVSAGLSKPIHDNAHRGSVKKHRHTVRGFATNQHSILASQLPRCGTLPCNTLVHELTVTTDAGDRLASDPCDGISQVRVMSVAASCKPTYRR